MMEYSIIDYVRILHETDKSYLLLLDDSEPYDPEKEWFPKSVCLLDDEEKEIHVPEWLAIEKGLV